MATVINAGMGGMICKLLSSMDTVSSGTTLVSGTSEWKSYDAIFYTYKGIDTQNQTYTYTAFHIVNAVKDITDNILLDHYFRTSPSTEGIPAVKYTVSGISVINTTNAYYDMSNLKIYGINF